MIDWAHLAQAVNFYETLGYQYREVPWIVSREVSHMTFPGDGFLCQAGALIGSAEQGFLALADEPGAKWVACSPCFRPEPVLNEFYQNYFMKVELYREGSHVDAVLGDALAFMGRMAHVEETPEGFDIMIGDVEVGSYGERQVGDRHWTYGTGLALPRWSVAMQRLGQPGRASCHSR